MSRTTLAVAATIAAASAAAAAPAQAATAIFTSRAAFDAAAGGGLLTDPFTFLPTAVIGSSLPDQDPAAGATYDFGPFSVISPRFQTVGGIQNANPALRGDVTVSTGFGFSAPPQPILFRTDLPSTAFGLQIEALPDLNGALVPLTLSAFGRTVDITAPGFFGFVSDTAASQFSLVAQGASRVIAPVTFDDVSVSPIPEPSTYAMMIAGLGVVGLLYRRRDRRA